MRPLLLVLALATSSAQTTSQTPAPVEIVNLEQHLWTAMAEGDFATVRSLFTKDFIEVEDHIQAVDALLISLKHCKLEAYELRDLQVRILSPDSASPPITSSTPSTAAPRTSPSARTTTTTPQVCGFANPAPRSGWYRPTPKLLQSPEAPLAGLAV
jgi:hypothetical protein